MAEYKTYTCDKCAKHDALRIKFDVDTEDDPCDGHRSFVHGYADLCHFHAVAERYRSQTADGRTAHAL
jgi:hypothetical protein